MKIEDAIAQALSRLRQHFGPLLSAAPPVSHEQVVELEHYVGTLSAALAAFLTCCDGLMVELDNSAEPTRLWSSTQMLEVWAGYASAALPESFVPINGDSAGSCDWLILSDGSLSGAVLRWNPWGGGALVIASSLVAYLDAWTRYLIENYDRDGRPVRADGQPAFDPEWVLPGDADLKRIYADPTALGEKLKRLDLVPAGRGCPRKK